DDLLQRLGNLVKHRPLFIAHRGGRYRRLPENSLEAMYRTAECRWTLQEVDVQVTKDLHLILMHDATLERTTNAMGKVQERELKSLSHVHLKDQAGNITPFRIPLLTEALKWAKGKTILVLDLKPGVAFDPVLKEIRMTRSENSVIVITYNLDDLKEYRRQAPELLYSANFSDPSSLSRILEEQLQTSRLLGFVGVSKQNIDLWHAVRSLGVPVILATVGKFDVAAIKEGKEYYETLYQLGADLLVTDEGFRSQCEDRGGVTGSVR
ncbi:MAG: glycerophosphodiester phosphodiesterase family protein, partial [Gammaproteobacteria bacterium]